MTAREQEGKSWTWCHSKNSFCNSDRNYCLCLTFLRLFSLVNSSIASWDKKDVWKLKIEGITLSNIFSHVLVISIKTNFIFTTIYFRLREQWYLSLTAGTAILTRNWGLPSGCRFSSLSRSPRFWFMLSSSACRLLYSWWSLSNSRL